ncbi:Flavin-dependent tryptophan halogenase RebH [Thalassocella blandensis]|nr:Flavin-dependent tryptophan halogenase RebH [Thalassocella blandensis]
MSVQKKKIVIVGGGTAGWMSAAALKFHFKQLVDITLIESSDIGTVGVGEATIPTIRNFYLGLGLKDLDVMRATRATCKLGIQFNDWLRPGSSFIHPFGLYGQDSQGIEFHQFWLKLRKQGLADELGKYSLGVALAEKNKFTLPAKNPPSSLSVFDWALHFDAALFAQYMREFSMSLGVEHLDAKITKVNLRESDGYIANLSTESGATVAGDLFIDCSGFRGLLIEEALHTGYESWQKWLLCDSAQAVQSIAHGTPSPYTRVDAKTAGWQWKIPLQHRFGNGHVYASGFMGDEEAQQVLFNAIPEQTISDAKLIKFTAGRRKKAWNKNCIAIGLSAGFLEPLESTSIALVQTAIEKIRTLLTNFDFDDAVVNEFNETTALEYERVRDFLILHYKATQRSDSEFWRFCQHMEIPESLSHKLALFKSSGYVVNYRWEMFHLPSWLAIFSGFDYLPDNYDMRVDAFPEAQLAKSFAKMQASIQQAVADTPDHDAFIAEFCAAEKY